MWTIIGMSLSFNIFIILALIAFVLAATGWTYRKTDLIAIGLALWALSILVGHLSSITVSTVLLVIAFIAVVAAAIGWRYRKVNLIAVGLALWMLSLIVTWRSAGSPGNGGRSARCRHPGRSAPAGEAGGDDDRDDRDQDHEGHDDVDLWEPLTETDRAEDPQRKRVLRACGKGRDDDLVERQREREHRSGHDGGRDEGQRDVPQHLEPICAEVHGSLDQRALRPAQARQHVVVDDHDAERRVADDDGQRRKRDPAKAEGGVQGDSGDDPRERERQHEHQADELAAEPRHAMDGERGA